ncbi:MAG TPA: ABC transporter ATP-binding protein [Cellulomonas sp.]
MPQHTEAAAPPAVLTVTDLAVTFDGGTGEGSTGTGPAVDHVSWALHAGQVTALVGESGSGKSVSALAVLGLLPRTAQVTGSIRLTSGAATGADGTELVGAGPATFRDVRGAVVSLVSQEPMSAWNPVLTIGHQVAEAVRAHARVPRRRTVAAVLDLLTEVGLPDPARAAASYPHQLSGGQLQRALVAMALAQDPVAVIADEPTTALDVTVQAGILDLLRRLRDERGTSVLLITHDMGVVADLADDVVVMRHGRVVEHAGVRDLFADPRDPYSRELLAAVPHLGVPARGTVVRSIPAAPDRDGGGGVDRGAGGPRADVAHPVVDVDRVRVVFPGRRGGAAVAAVDDVSVRIAAGEVLGLVGESGSGKSTLALVLAGLQAPTSGRVVVDGTDIARASRAERLARRRSTGIVFQDPASTLNPRWSVARSVAEPLRLHTRLSTAAQRARVLELLDQVRLSADLAVRFPHELSGGQRQRVAIARAVALEPRLLIADEPTSALDVSVQARVLEVFHELQQAHGFACLFVSHNLAVVERVADRVAVLHDGRLVEAGPTADVLHHPQDDYTRRLVASVPVADPDLQAARRARLAEV